MVERRIQHLTTVLELNTAQQAQAKTIFSEEATALQALQTRHREARTALQNAVQNTGLDADIDRAAAELGALHTQTTAKAGKAQAKFRAILTPEQKEKLDAMRGPGLRGSGGPGGPGRRF
jgi:Spy/CpxP family protein refolding chaperone